MREALVQELARLPEQDLWKLLAFPRSLKEARAENAVPTLAAEPALAKDWLTPEEDETWAVCKGRFRSPELPVLRPQPDEAAPRIGFGIAGRRRRDPLSDHQ